MASYRFQALNAVPSAKDLVDIVLSTPQRKTPTQCHKQFQIGRIRKFYTRKVKFCQQTYHDRLTTILTDFPKLDDIHPFYADLCNVLYDRDHYKLALGQVNAVRGAIDRLASDYVKMMKYADSQFKCKSLKRSALGRMCTIMRKLQQPLLYLEEVRQHLSRLPSINPNSRSIILCGYPNVGKSSFMNQLSHANVDVQPYAFTTKNLYVGHFDYNFTRWQIIDTPGVLDRPLNEKNTVELTAITALTHIQAAILYFVDITEECGYSLDAQVALFHDLKVLFRDRPIVVCCNKTDVRLASDLSEGEQELLKSMKDGIDNNVSFVHMSTKTGDNVRAASDNACAALLESLVLQKSQTKRIRTIENRLTVAQPKKVNTNRLTRIPDSVKIREENEEEVEDIQLARDLCEANGGVGVFSYDNRKEWELKDADWTYDEIPEFLNGRNIADFVDHDIDAKLALLEAEEDAFAREYMIEDKDDGGYYAAEEVMDEITQKRRLKIEERRVRQGKNTRPRLHKRPELTEEGVKEDLGKLGYQLDGILAHIEPKEKNRMAKELQEEDAYIESLDSEMDAPEEEDETANAAFMRKLAERDFKKKTKADRRLRVSGKYGVEERKKAKAKKDKIQGVDRADVKEDIAKKNQRFIYGMAKKGKERNNRVGEADRKISDKKPRHLFSGKRGFDADRR